MQPFGFASPRVCGRRVLAQLAALSLTVGSSRVAHANGEVVAAQSDAYVSVDNGGQSWMIGNRLVSLVVSVASGDLQIVRFGRVDSGQLSASSLLPGSDTAITVNGRSSHLGRSGGFTFDGSHASPTQTGVQLDLCFWMSGRLKVTRHYAVYAGSPTIETWTTLKGLSGSVPVSNLNGWQLKMAPGVLHWINGLRGDNADVPHDEAFSLQQRELAPGETQKLGSHFRSSEQHVPWIAIEGASGDSPAWFYGALLWSGSWELSAERTGATMSVTLGVPEVSTNVQRDQTLDTPRAIFGIAAGGMAEATSALRSFIERGIRPGRPLNPSVIYNTWFAYGTSINEDAMHDEMTRAKALGAEIFVLDAGWYVGAGPSKYDYVSGLGSWQVDPGRFPSGLRALADYAHGLGLKFGIWVEPERVALELLGRVDGLREEWLATSGGTYQDPYSAQICLGSAAAHGWLLSRLFALLDDVNPDYLKWDNNFWVNCTRAGHNHGFGDGNFAHVSGLYDMLSKIRDRYPNLLIENVAGGARRLDLGMLRYTDVAWMDDRSAPSVHVRHNLEGLAAVFPPAYLFSFVVNHEGEQLQSAADLALYFRSRMIGVLGLCFRSDELGADDTEAIRSEIAIYKSVRDILKDASAVLLTDQAGPGSGPAWDVLQVTSDAGGAMIAAVQADDGVRRITVRPTNLQRDATYEVRSVDSGLLATATGAELMTDGIEIQSTSWSAAHLLVLKRQDE